MSEPDLTKPYDPAAVEKPERWYAFWEKHGVFEATDDPKDTRPAYVLPMPPPNVTGSLHMGHALTCTLEDALARWHRMRGFVTLWQPGMDHAGIATQTVVERQLAREGTSRQAMGREAFTARVWKWKGESGGRISTQQRVLGASPDWRRTKFTMDPEMSRAVTEAFVRLHDEGLIYRATRLINWCPDCMTALSDLEVENEEGANGELFEFAYKVDGPDENGPRELVVATTRAETMLGDTAVAVHPEDPRYKDLHGKMLVHPFVDRKIPVVTDAILVDPKFGTGAVKVTPAHDFNDFATGKRHGLEEISIFNLDGTVNANGGRFAGLDRKKARSEVKKALDALGLAKGTKAHILNIPRCQRSNTVVEPMISTQWFCKMKEMADAAIAAVKTGETKIVPEEWQKTYDHFLENIQDWCVSRQLWWGHQIPAWHGPNGDIVVAREKPAGLGPEYVQDPDVLDTWFSSALWPFSTLGWPESTDALKKFYGPQNGQADLETGYDILFFWVARMMMFGIHFMGRAPFKRVLLHGMVVDETGDKMSKVKGNVIDPLDLVHGADFKEVVAKALPGAPEGEALAKFKKAYPSAAQMGAGFPAFGADALRYTLATFPPSNKRIALAPKRIEGYRHFVNKIWNATRLSLDLLKGMEAAGEVVIAEDPYNRWILSRLAGAVVAANEGFDSFRIDEAANALYRFFWNDFCDWYLEIAKTVLRDAQTTPLVVETRATLAFVLETSLRALHPLMPYVTEELWQRLPRPVSRPASIALAPYPTAAAGHHDPSIEQRIGVLQSVIGAARTVRAEHDIKPAAEVPLRVRCDDETTRGWLADRSTVIKFLVKTKDAPVFERTGGAREGGTTVSVVPTEAGSIEVLVNLKGLVTADDERARIDREIKRIDKEVGVIDKKLSAKGFVERAPKEVVDETQGQRRALVEARGRLEEAKTLIAELES